MSIETLIAAAKYVEMQAANQMQHNNALFYNSSSTSTSTTTTTTTATTTTTTITPVTATEPITTTSSATRSSSLLSNALSKKQRSNYHQQTLLPQSLPESNAFGVGDNSNHMLLQNNEYSTNRNNVTGTDESNTALSEYRIAPPLVVITSQNHSTHSLSPPSSLSSYETSRSRSSSLSSNTISTICRHNNNIQQYILSSAGGEDSSQSSLNLSLSSGYISGSNSSIGSSNTGNGTNFNISGVAGSSTGGNGINNIINNSNNSNNSNNNNGNSNTNVNIRTSVPSNTAAIININNINIDKHHIQHQQHQSHITTSRRRTVSANCVSNKSKKNNCVSATQRSPCILRAGTREVHNKLEKNRRAHLKECFETLKKTLPLMPEDKKTSNLSILGSACRHVATLKKKERELEIEMEQLAKEKIAKQQIVLNLRRELTALGHIDAWETTPDFELGFRERIPSETASEPAISTTRTRYGSTSSLSSVATASSPLTTSAILNQPLMPKSTSPVMPSNSNNNISNSPQHSQPQTTNPIPPAMPISLNTKNSNPTEHHVINTTQNALSSNSSLTTLSSNSTLSAISSLVAGASLKITQIPNGINFQQHLQQQQQKQQQKQPVLLLQQNQQQQQYQQQAQQPQQQQQQAQQPQQQQQQQQHHHYPQQHKQQQQQEQQKELVQPQQLQKQPKQQQQQYEQQQHKQQQHKIQLHQQQQPQNVVTTNQSGGNNIAINFTTNESISPALLTTSNTSSMPLNLNVSCSQPITSIGQSFQIINTTNATHQQQQQQQQQQQLQQGINSVSDMPTYCSSSSSSSSIVSSTLPKDLSGKNGYRITEFNKEPIYQMQQQLQQQQQHHQQQQQQQQHPLPQQQQLNNLNNISTHNQHMQITSQNALVNAKDIIIKKSDTTTKHLDSSTSESATKVIKLINSIALASVDKDNKYITDQLTLSQVVVSPLPLLTSSQGLRVIGQAPNGLATIELTNPNVQRSHQNLQSVQTTGAQLHKLLVGGTTSNVTTTGNNNTIFTTTSTNPNTIASELTRLPGGAELNILPAGSNGTALYRGNGITLKGNEAINSNRTALHMVTPMQTSNSTPITNIVLSHGRLISPQLSGKVVTPIGNHTVPMIGTQYLSTAVVKPMIVTVASSVCNNNSSNSNNNNNSFISSSNNNITLQNGTIVHSSNLSSSLSTPSSLLASSSLTSPSITTTSTTIKGIGNNGNTV